MQLKTDGLTTVPFELIVSEDTECYKSGSENDTQIVSTLIVEHEYKQPKDCADNVIMPIPYLEIALGTVSIWIFCYPIPRIRANVFKSFVAFETN